MMPAQDPGEESLQTHPIASVRARSVLPLQGGKISISSLIYRVAGVMRFFHAEVIVCMTSIAVT